LLNGGLYFAINGKNSAETILHFELCPLHLSSHVTLSSSSNVNIVEWLVPMPAVRVLVGSALIISFGLPCRNYTLDGNAFNVGYFFKKFKALV